MSVSAAPTCLERQAELPAALEAWYIAVSSVVGVITLIQKLSARTSPIYYPIHLRNMN